MNKNSLKNNKTKKMEEVININNDIGIQLEEKEKDEKNIKLKEK